MARRKEHAFSLSELAWSVGLLAVALGMYRIAALLVSQQSASQGPLLAGALALGASFLTGALAGNAVAVLTVGREHAIDGVIIGGAALTLPLMAIYIQFVNPAAL